MKIKWIIASLILAFSLSACSPSPEEITETVKESLQESLSTDADYAKYNLIVGDIELVKVGDNQYKALAEVYLDDKLNIVPLDVYAEGNIFEYNAIWESKPGAFLFVAQREINDALDEFNVEMDNLETEFQSSLDNLEAEYDSYTANDTETEFDYVNEVDYSPDFSDDSQAEYDFTTDY